SDLHLLGGVGRIAAPEPPADGHLGAAGHAEQGMDRQAERLAPEIADGDAERGGGGALRQRNLMQAMGNRRLRVAEHIAAAQVRRQRFLPAQSAQRSPHYLLRRPPNGAAAAAPFRLPDADQTVLCMEFDDPFGGLVEDRVAERGPVYIACPRGNEYLGSNDADDARIEHAPSLRFPAIGLPKGRLTPS